HDHDPFRHAGAQRGQPLSFGHAGAAGGRLLQSPHCRLRGRTRAALSICPEGIWTTDSGDGPGSGRNCRLALGVMKIAVLNTGSGSQNLSVFTWEGNLPEEPPTPVWSARIDSTAPGQPEGKLWMVIRDPAGERRETVSRGDSFEEKVGQLFDFL